VALVTSAKSMFPISAAILTILTDNFADFSQSLQWNDRILPEIKPRRLLSSHVAVPYSPVLLLFDAVKPEPIFASLNKLRTNKLL
jgi:hypothetical protein